MEVFDLPPGERKYMKKRVLEFDNGMRTTSSGNTTMEPSGATLVREIDISVATDKEFRKLMKNPKDKMLIGKLTRRSK